MRKKLLVILTVILTISVTNSASSGNSGEIRQDDPLFHAELKISDKTGAPVPKAWVWVVSDSGRFLRGRTDENGVAEFEMEVGSRMDAYFAGEHASLEISEKKETYSLTMPLILTDLSDDLPRVIVSVRPDDLNQRRMRVTISSDVPLISKPEVDIHLMQMGESSSPCTHPYSVTPRMASVGNDYLWEGTSDSGCDYNRGFIEVSAASESGSNYSVNIFSIYDAGYPHYDLYFLSFGGEMRCTWDGTSDSGKMGAVGNFDPAPENGELFQVGEVMNFELSDNAGTIRDVEFSINLFPERLRGVDTTQLSLFGRDRITRTWKNIGTGDYFCANYGHCTFGTAVNSADYVSYALFAPESTDTVPPDAVTDLQSASGYSEWGVRLQWTAPADDRAVLIYNVRYSTTPLTESGWYDASPISLNIPQPAEPGISQIADIKIRRTPPGTEYYFGIRAMDAAGNWSPVTSTDTPVKVFVTDNDGDGMRDGWEESNGLDPTSDDSQYDEDRDGLTNLGEYRHETSSWNPDTDEDGFSDGDEAYLGSDPRDSGSHPDSAAVRLTSETDDPVRTAEVWLVSGTRRSFQGKSDGEGIVISAVGTGIRLEAYFAGRKASLEIDEIKDEYQIVMPPAQENIPGIVASVTADDSAPGRVTLKIFSDSPLSEPEVSLYQPPGYSADLPMTSPDSLVWSGAADISSGWGVFEIIAVSGSAQSISAVCFEIHDIEAEGWDNYEFRETELTTWDRFSGSGKLVLSESPAPSVRNALVRVGNVRNLFFSENVGTVTDVRLEAYFSADQLGGLDFTQLNFFGWDTENRTWNLIPEDGNLSSDLSNFRISADALDYTSYALFAPRIDDTTPPGPVTDFQVRTDRPEYCDYFEEEGCVYITWTSPADDQMIYTYDIRYSTVTVTESNWDDCVQPGSSDYSDSEPGIFHERRIGTSQPGTAFYFGIQAVDVAGNRSPITFFDTPVISSADRDGDGMDDTWETANGLNTGSDDALNDKDGDGLTNMREYGYSLDPGNPDTDGDGYSDGDEMRFGGNPRDETVQPSGDLDCDSDIGLGDAVLALRLLIADAVPDKLCPGDIGRDDRIGLAETIFILRGLAEEE